MTYNHSTDGSVNATDVCKRQIQINAENSLNFCKIVFHHFIWNHHEKCIHMSTNMPGIGYVICEIFGNSMKSEKQFCMVTNSLIPSVNAYIQLCKVHLCTFSHMELFAIHA